MKMAIAIVMMLENWMKQSVFTKIMFQQCKWLELMFGTYNGQFIVFLVVITITRKTILVNIYCFFPGWT
uniref:Uncharacterized protein n=1 Tax=Rhizophora mucronata TaxID=61149 RepID=A0A2P2LPI1_RHIMU